MILGLVAILRNVHATLYINHIGSTVLQVRIRLHSVSLIEGLSTRSGEIPPESKFDRFRWCTQHTGGIRIEAPKRISYLEVVVEMPF